MLKDDVFCFVPEVATSENGPARIVPMLVLTMAVTMGMPSDHARGVGSRPCRPACPSDRDRYGSPRNRGARGVGHRHVEEPADLDIRWRIGQEVTPGTAPLA